MSSVVTLLTVTLPLPSHWGHLAGYLCGVSAGMIPVPWHSWHTAIRGGRLISLFMIGFISVHIGHAEGYVTPCAFVVPVLGADIFLGYGRLITLLDDAHAVDESLVAAVVGHLA